MCCAERGRAPTGLATGGVGGGWRRWRQGFCASSRPAANKHERRWEVQARSTGGPRASSATPAGRRVQQHSGFARRQQLDDSARYTVPAAAVAEAAQTLGGAASWGDDTVVRQLLSKGASPNDLLHFFGHQDRGGYAPLWSAAANGHATCVRALLNNSADISWSRANGDTAVHVAARDGHREAVRELLQHKAAGITSGSQRRLVGATTNMEKDTALIDAALNDHAETVQQQQQQPRTGGGGSAAAAKGSEEQQKEEQEQHTWQKEGARRCAGAVVLRSTSERNATQWNEV